ncbi:hypothetical protein D3C75_974600 [compost metagenome]
MRYGRQLSLAADGRDNAFAGIPGLHAHRAAECRDGEFGQFHVIPHVFGKRGDCTRFRTGYSPKVGGIYPAIRTPISGTISNVLMAMDRTLPM